ncbi:PKD domain-containing protein [Halobellus litoreus]|uniref:PKD domain-containing protein n=1 Tax=Halobellus litoreus TaxID=755310 RepID=A0ABD6DWQ7_9EURY
MAAEPGVSISQTATSGTTVAPGETITIEATIDYTDVNGPGINATVPDGWSVISHSDDGGTYGPPQPAWIWLAGGETGANGNHTVSYTVQVPTDASSGDYTFSAAGSAGNPAGGPLLESTDELTVTVQENQQPSASFSVTPSDPGAGQTVSFDAAGSSDPDGSIDSYSWDFGDGTAATGATPSHTYDSSGSYTATLTVTDDDGATATSQQTVSVSQANQGPTASVTLSPTDPEVGQTVSFDASGSSDPDGSIASYEWNFGDGTAATGATPSHAYDSTGTYQVNLTVTDDDGATATDTTEVTVEETEPTLDPSVSITQTASSSTSVQPGDTVSVETTIDYADVNGPAIDVTLPDGWSVTSHTDDGGAYGPPEPAWVWSPEGGATGATGSHTVSYTVQVPADTSPDDYTFAAEASGVAPGDQSFVNDTTDLTVTVQAPPNQSPTADAGSDQTVEEETAVTLDASGSSDPDGSIDSYAWSQSGGPAVSLSDTAAAQATFTAPNVDTETTLTFTVEVTDEDGETATDTIEVTVEPTAPTLNPSVSVAQTATSPTSVQPGDTVSVEATINYADVNAPAIDVTLPDGWSVASHSDDGGTYGPPQPAWVWGQQGSETGLTGINTVTYTVQVPADTSPGDYTFAAEASGVDPSDDSFTTDTTDLTVTVQAPVNQDPVASVSATPSDPEVGQTVSFDASESSDSDGSIASYSWDFGEGTTATGANPSHTYDSAGTYTVTLTVTDDDGATATATQQVTVSPAPNQAPSAGFTSSPSAPTVGQQVTLDASGSNDADGSIESYQWTIETPGTTGETTLLDTDFEADSLAAAGWTHGPADGTASAGVSDATSNSGSQSAFHQGGAGALVSPSVDATGSQSIEIDYWVQKGHDDFSENPDANDEEDLVVEFLASSGNWVEIGRIESTASPGAIVDESVVLSDAAALHDGLQVRFRQQGADATNGDYWHVDDVAITTTTEQNQDITMTGNTATFTPSTTGDYEVTLSVTDDDGATDSTSQTITVDESTPDDQSISQAVASLNDAGDDSVIGTQEIQQAIDLWVGNDPVPGTGGETISTPQIQQLIDSWVGDETVDSANGGENE